jgi:pimeloyl-ACP methyl ester carboxylesterase
MDALFLPGWAAPASLYAPLLPLGWTALEPPPFGAAGARLEGYRRWLGAELHARGRCVLGGHSMGGALALLAAAAHPELVARLVLVSPAGLPITKPIRHSAADFARQAARGVYPLRTVVRGAASLARTPRAAMRLAAQVRALDLRDECDRVRARGVPAVVVGCRSDTLVRCEHARALAGALGADYLELATHGGHMWMLGDRLRFAGLLRALARP